MAKKTKYVVVNDFTYKREGVYISVSARSELSEGDIPDNIKESLLKSGRLIEKSEADSKPKIEIKETISGGVDLEIPIGKRKGSSEDDEEGNQKPRKRKKMELSESEVIPMNTAAEITKAISED